MYPNCNFGWGLRKLCSNISWKCVAAMTLGGSFRFSKCSRIPHARPIPSIPKNTLTYVLGFGGKHTCIPFSSVPLPNSSIRTKLRLVACFRDREICCRLLINSLWIWHMLSTKRLFFLSFPFFFPINTCSLTLETLSWVSIFTSILSVIPTSALSAGTKLFS